MRITWPAPARTWDRFNLVAATLDLEEVPLLPLMEHDEDLSWAELTENSFLCSLQRPSVKRGFRSPRWGRSCGSSREGGLSQNFPPGSGAKLSEEEASALFADGDTEAEVQREGRAGLGTGRPACSSALPPPPAPGAHGPASWASN